MNDVVLCCAVMQVTLEGYVSKSSEHLSQLTRRRCKLLSSEVVRVRAIYGLKSLGQLYGGQRSFQYPFVLSLPKNAVPSCPASGRLLSVQVTQPLERSGTWTLVRRNRLGKSGTHAANTVP